MTVTATGQLLKQTELRRFVGRRFERAIRWLPADRAVVGRLVTLDDLTEGWEVISVHEPGLPADVVRHLLART
jgi:hypothetical protein